jgi:hypothetical protein
MKLKSLQETFKNIILQGDMETPLPIVENNLTAEARLSVYQRNTYRTLTEFLEVSYPKTFSLLGKDHFQRLSHAFISKHPPSRADLDAFAFPFVETLTGFPRDVATFENALRAILLKPMPPRLDPKCVEGLAHNDPDHLRFVFHPTTVLYASPFAFQNFWHILEETPQDYTPEPTYMLLHVVGLRAMFKPLNEGEWMFLKVLESGNTIQKALLEALKVHPAFDLEKKLNYAMSHRIFESVKNNN